MQLYELMCAKIRLLDLFFLLHQAIDDFLLLAQLIAKCLVIGLLRMGFRSLAIVHNIKKKANKTKTLIKTTLHENI